MPEFKNSGTGYTEHPSGSQTFKPKERKHEKPDVPTEGRKHCRSNPDREGGPQVY